MIRLRIKELSKERNILLKDLADKIKMSRVSLTRIAQGDQNPTMEKLEEIAKALGVEVADLFQREDSKVFHCPKCGARFELKED